MVNARPIPGEKMRWYVDSHSVNGGTYIVDLLANKGSGQCTCTDFTTRRAPAIKNGAPLFTRETTCKHVQEVYRLFLKQILTRIYEDSRDDRPAPYR